MVEHIPYPEEFSRTAPAVAVNPLQEQYLLSMTGGGGPTPETTTQRQGLVNNDGTLTVPALTTTTRPATGQTDATTTTAQPTDGSATQTTATNGVDSQVNREYTAGLAMMQNPGGGGQQLMQTLGQFGPTPGSDPAYKAWMGGYTQKQIDDAYLQAQLAAGPMVGLWARLNEGTPSVARAIQQVTDQYNKQVEAQATPSDSSKTSTDQAAAADPTAQSADQTAQADPTDTAVNGGPGTEATNQPAVMHPGTQAALRPSVLRRQAPGTAPTLESAQNNFISQEASQQFNWGANSSNADCGPTSLAMAFKQLGVTNPGADPGGAERLVTASREEMTGRNNHQESTSMDQVKAAAAREQVPSQTVHGLDGINQALENGGVVVSPGNPAYAWGPRLGANYETVNGRTWGGAHIVLVNGIDKQSGNYIVSDPLSKVGAIEVTPQEMANYIAGAQAPPGYPALHGGVALYRRPMTSNITPA